ncbi:FeoB-associated Cys-rich membrane protein [Butyrivibrio sp. FC2001]|uniref:FeoB-associated Cys-rich membrane protein n=1 Tax=Butyrivibrio sp. FC2001 TaxID=1280671 RepID=UPI000401CF0C|nr:FeoB-associated Cys-rich membrane protein [Butyrivibrio sp. FC2001]
MTNIIIVLIIAAIIIFDIRYIIKKKKQGGCIGCPSGSSCHSGSGSCPTAEKFKKYHEEQAKLRK